MRTDGDTWDLTAGVGATATGVAAARALASGRPGALIDDPYARPLVVALGIDHYVKLADGNGGVDDAGMDWDAVADGMAVRTHFFDEFLAAAMAAGVRQAVILASGLDARPYRLDWPAGTTVFELDQPAVVEFKSRTLASLGAIPAAALQSIGIDLRGDWPNALCQHGFDQFVPTAWIAEGLLGYLPPAAQDRLFDDITAISAPASMLATDWHPDLSVPIAERARSDGADIQDPAHLIYLGERNDVADYLTALGWQVCTHAARTRFDTLGMTFPADATVAGLTAAHYTMATLE